MTSIFTITALTDAPWGSPKRTWGWYPTFKEAEAHVLKGDDCLLESGTYDFLMIEEVPVGAFTLCENRWWYKADCIRWTENGHPMFDYKITPVPCPKWAESIANFSMG